MSEMSLFGPPAPPSPDHRVPDHATSVAAAVSVRWIGVGLRARVFHAIAAASGHGLTDLELEAMPGFTGYAPSTVRKRRSELYQQGRLDKAGVRDGATVWVVAPEEAGDAAP